MEIEREIVVPEAPDEVWEALTEPERLEEWFASEVELDARPGGEGVFRWGDGDERRAVVRELEEAERLVLDWDDGGSVAIELEPVSRRHPRARRRVLAGVRSRVRAARAWRGRRSRRRRPRLRRARRRRAPLARRGRRGARHGDRDRARGRAAGHAASRREAALRARGRRPAPRDARRAARRATR